MKPRHWLTELLNDLLREPRLIMVLGTFAVIAFAVIGTVIYQAGLFISSWW